MLPLTCSHSSPLLPLPLLLPPCVLQVVLAWREDLAVISFRGTASAKNLALDLKVYQVCVYGGGWGGLACLPACLPASLPATRHAAVRAPPL